MSVRANWQALLAMACALLAFVFLPMTEGASTFMAVTIIMLIAMGAAASAVHPASALSNLVLGICPHIAVYLLIRLLPGAEGRASASFFLALAACWLLAWRLASVLSGDGSLGSGEGWLGAWESLPCSGFGY